MEYLPLGLAFASGLTFGTVMLHQWIFRMGTAEVDTATGKQPIRRAATQDPQLLEQLKISSDKYLSQETQIKVLLETCEELRLAHQKVEDHLVEIREQAACRFASEIESLQDQNELLFVTWSEGLKEELEERQSRLHQHAQGEHMALEIRLGQIEKAVASATIGPAASVMQQPVKASPTKGIADDKFSDVAVSIPENDDSKHPGTAESAQVESPAADRLQNTAASRPKPSLQPQKVKKDWVPLQRKLSGGMKGLSKFKTAI